MLDPACFVLAPGMTVRSLFPVLLCLVGQSFKDRRPTSEGRKAESVTYSPCTAGVSLSRLRVQRYADFSIPPNICGGFLKKLAKKVDFGLQKGKFGLPGEEIGGAEGEKGGEEAGEGGGGEEGQ